MLSFALATTAAAQSGDDASHTKVEKAPASAEVGPPSGIEVIRVTGKTVTSIETEVPSSVTQFDASALDAIGAQDLSDLAKVTPSLEINTVSSTSPTFFIRGVGLSDFNANATGAVAIYQDGVPINAPAIQLGQLFDVGSVEVLRGPQPYGDDRNASAGAIKAWARRPDGSLEANLRADYGNYNARDIEGAISAPLAGDMLATRLAFRYAQRDPIAENRCGGAPPTPTTPAYCDSNRTLGQVPTGLPDGVNDEGRWGARGLLRFRPPDTEMDWLLNAHGSHVNQLSTLGQVYGTNTGSNFFGGGTTSTGYRDPVITQLVNSTRQALFDSGLRGQELTNQLRATVSSKLAKDISLAKPYDGAYDLVGSERQDAYGGSLGGDLSLGPIAVNLISGAEKYNRTRATDFDFSPNPAIHTFLEDRAWQFTQSIRAGSELDEVPLRWQVGGYYLTEQLNSSTNFLFNFTGTRVGRNLLQEYTQGTNSYGAYANFTLGLDGLAWDFLDRLTIDGGARYNREHKTFELRLERLPANSNDPGVQYLPGEDEKTWSSPTGGIGLTYHLDDDSSVYLKYSHGWKSGTFNAAILENRQTGAGNFAPEITSAAPETIDAFEMGLRGTWFDDRIELGGSLFYYKYQDYQVFVLKSNFGAPPQFEIINANDAKVYGGELDFRIEPLAGWVPTLVEGLVLSGRFGWLESEFLDFSDTQSFDEGTPPVTVTRVVDYTGNTLPNAPQFKLSGSVEWTLDLGAYGALIPRYDFSYTDDVFFNPSEGRGFPNFTDGSPLFPEYAIGQRAYWLHNARLAYQTPDGTIEVSGWVRNLTNMIYKRYVADATFGFNTVLNFVGDPRTFGGSVSIRF